MARRRIAAPMNPILDHHRFRHGKGRIPGVIAQIPARRPDAVAHQRIRPAQPSVMGAGIGVQQQLVRVEAVAIFRRIGAMGTKAVALPRPHPVHPHVPDIAIPFAKQHPGHFLAAILGKQAQFDQMGMRRKHREIDASGIDAGPHRPGPPRSLFHARRTARQIAADQGHPFSSAYSPA